MIRKEYGSDFHFPISAEWLNDDSVSSEFIHDDFSLFFSGRAALYFLLQDGIEKKGWKQVYIPSYYCKDVPNFIKQLPIDVIQYPSQPFQSNEIDTSEILNSETTVVVRVSYFGNEIPSISGLRKCIIVDDLTHNLESVKKSQAHYCFGSLRKELPIPVGGFCYSPKGYNLPEVPVHSESQSVTHLKFDAMKLKQEYLFGKEMDKSLYLEMFRKGEAGFEQIETASGLPISAKEALSSVNTSLILGQKKKNHRMMLDLLKAGGPDSLNNCLLHSSRYPYGLIFYFQKKEEKQNFKAFLISNKIYPATLWPNQTLETDMSIEERMLFLHVDFRYTAENISEIAQKIISFFN